tara:strand:+ start:317 stop:1342 length:1026 start_codon:yes stop_codon:yes gene_type:complete
MDNILILFVFLINLSIIIFYNKISPLFKIVDASDGKRKFQKKPVPLIGGTLLIININVYILINYFFAEFKIFNELVSTNRELFALIFGINSFYLFGLYDDKYRLKSNSKLLVSIFLVSSIILIDDNLFINILNFSFLNNEIELRAFTYLFTLLSIMLFINALNMFDGINLQAGSYSCFIFIIFFYNGILENFILIIIMSLLFFLFLNFFNKAFLGESGVQLLAFIISYVFIKTNNNFVPTFYADEIFIILALPGLDMFRLFIIRLIKGNHPFKADTNHIHHLLNCFFSKTKTFLIIFTIIISSVILYYFFENKLLYIISYIIFYVVFINFINYKIRSEKNI